MHFMLNLENHPFDSFGMTKPYDDVVKSRGVPLLKYDISTGIYSSYKKYDNEFWVEYDITKLLK